MSEQRAGYITTVTNGEKPDVVEPSENYVPEEPAWYADGFATELLTEKAVTEYMKRSASVLTVKEAKLLGRQLRSCDTNKKTFKAVYELYYTTWSDELTAATDNPFFED